jgi:RNA polymerase sigma-70 factor (ECF subfamily)
MTAMLGATFDRAGSADDWTRDFHAGERRVIEQLYVDYYSTVSAAIGVVLRGPDRETVIHEVFATLIEHREMREAFRGGSIAAWLTTVARNRAIDLVRRRGRERTAIGELRAIEREDRVDDLDVAAEARRQLSEFRATLRASWVPVFDACFVQRMSQREAARTLAMPRTTLAYRELKIRRALRRYLLEDRHG